ncbi:S9 family peptidase [Terrilactibacillus laevilacticus]|uniref:S9 family peptidase n=1 Tax=Terrilactibacillus laevilacticus TaxID=1380157 RepID=UPI00114779D7|nr:S9 family peptidase [Terrilactibacillus laevilacticus]
MTKRTITTNDLYSFNYSGSPRFSPNGSHIVYVVTTTSKEKNGYASSLYLSHKQQRSIALTRPYADKNVRDHSPFWSKDGKWIYFLSDRVKNQQVWRIASSGGEAEKVTTFEHSVQHFALSNDGHKLVCQLSIPLEKETDNDDVTIVTQLRYLANGTGIILKSPQLFLLNLTKPNEKAKALTMACERLHSAIFSTDDNAIFYCKGKSNPEKHDYLYSLYEYDLLTDQENKLYDGKGSIYNLQPSPNGQYVAFCGHDDDEVSPQNNGIWLYSLTNRTCSCITHEEKYSIGQYISTDARFDKGNPDFVWNANSDSLTYLVTVHGGTSLRTVDLYGRISSNYESPDEVITSFDRVGSAFTFIAETHTTIGDLYFLKDRHKSQLSCHNKTLFDQLMISEPKAFHYKSEDDWEIDGWIIFPPLLEKSKKVPVVLEIHGGPASAYGNTFSHEFQCLAAEGYAVVYTNPRGSQGRGSEFTAACYGDWGKKDRLDILNGLDYALEHFSWCDREKLFVTGGSYGGFMTNTIIGQTSRFTAAVTQRCISNLYSFFGTSDIGYYFGSRELGNVDLWEDEEQIMSFSPIRYAKQVTTPACIIHSEEDYRCPIEQAEQWYVALKRLGVETRFVRIKGENHELSRSGKPKNRISRLHEIINWFNRYS